MLMILARLVRSEKASGRSLRFAPRTPARKYGTLDRGVGDLGDESGASSLPTGPEFSALPPDGVVALGFGPAPFSCAWSVPVMSVLRDAELVSWGTDLVTG